jgi:DNA helicase-2/ATP-dependent DNA helicase PcrA
MTRANDELQLLMPERFFTHQKLRYGDRHVYAARSRFIPGAILHHFECRSGASPSGTPPASTRPAPRSMSGAGCGRYGAEAPSTTESESRRG